jgi:bifunctional non-homologous end joining protein LigD
MVIARRCIFMMGRSPSIPAVAWTGQSNSPVAAAAKRLKTRHAIFDGEAVAYGATGLPDFQALRRELGKRKSGTLRYHAFDLLYLDGRDLRQLSYVKRKQELERLLKGAPEIFIYAREVRERLDPLIQRHSP